MVSAPMRFAMLPLLVSLALLPAQAMAQEGAPTGEAPAPASTDEQPSTPPAGTPPPPPEGMSPSSPDTEATDGRWVYTDTDGWVWVPAGSVASDVNAEPYVYLYEPSIGWSWFLSPWGEGPFFVGPWVHAPHRLEGRPDGQHGAPGHVGPRFVGPRTVTPVTPAVPRYVAPRYVEPRYVAPSPMAPGHLGTPYVAPRPVAPSYAAPRYAAPPPVAPRYVAPPVYHPAPALAPHPAFGGHMAAPVGGGGPHR
jgi:hypothetical protein